MGAELAAELACQGWRLALHACSRVGEAQQLASSLGSPGTGSGTEMGTEAEGAAHCVLQADFTEPGAADSLAREAEEALGGPPELFVHAAGLFLPDRSGSDVGLTRHRAVLAEAAFELAGAVAEGGLAVLLADAEPAAARAGGLGAYATAAEELLARIPAAARRLAPRRVRLNALALGPVFPSPRQSEASFRRLAARRPLAAPTGAGEAAAGLAFFLKAPSCTGAVLALDGGARLLQSAALAPPSHYEVRIEGLELAARIGWHESERAAPQRLRLSLRASPAAPPALETPAFAEDELASALDYSALAAWLREAVQRETEAGGVRLLETLAERLLDELFARFPRIGAAELAIDKPEIYRDAEAAGVLLRRRRPPA